MKGFTGIILAAGEGTRMKSTLPKVLHQLCGQPILKYMLNLLGQVGMEKSIVVVGHQAEQVKTLLKGHSNIKTVRQSRLLGSADAVRQTKRCFAHLRGNVVIVYGDTPLISYQSLKNLIQLHKNNQAVCTMLTAILKNPTGFGRIIRNEDNHIVKIVEEQDADTYERAVSEINVGAYCFRTKELFATLEKIKPNNVKKEYYLTDAIGLLVKNRAKIASVLTQEEEEALGVNCRQDLARAQSAINSRNIERLSAQGVTIIDPATTYIYGQQIEIAADTVIYPQTVIEGKVKIGRSCKIGPFARLRSGTRLAEGVEIGNFVELVRTKVGCNSKIKHHSYIGDAIIGQNVNVGAGTITANYDGKNKNLTQIADAAFIGVGTVLIAPVKIGKAARTGAGSVITKNKNVPAGATVVGVPARIFKKHKSSKKGK